ncbi:MAG: M48 family metallopeptidase [Clostridiales bacterium]|nr:M48 family metallopeptidase [Clostridiales bacterium]
MGGTPNVDYEYTLERSDRKTLSVAYHPKKGVLVKAPNGLSEERILIFLAKHEDWINKQISQNEQEKHYFDDVIKCKKILFLGKKMSVVRVDDTTKLTERWFAVKFGQDVARNAKRVLKNEAVKLIPEIVKEYAAKMGVTPKSVEIKDYKSRNGACTNEGDLTFSWRIIMVDYPLVEYVVVHELAHLKHFDHSKDFWKEVEIYIPDYKKRRKALELYRIKDTLYR